jgi:transglutaminase-like putative cysteine protease
MAPLRRLLIPAVVMTTVLALAPLTLTAQAYPSGQPTWPPISAQDLALKDSPITPGEPAMILYYDVRTDNTNATETVFVRIKIFREKGKKYADIEIPYFEKQTAVEEIHASVTSSNGNSENFSGNIYDKEVVKMKKFRWSAKALTLPNVEVGSIIEYSYRLHWHAKIPDVFRNPSRYIIDAAIAYPAAEWTVQRDLSVQHAHFVLHSVAGARTATFKRNLPASALQRTLADGTVELTVENVPAFQKEDYSPPEDFLKMRANVFYILGFVNDPRVFWMDLARREAEYYDAFIGKPKSVQKEVDRILSPGDSDETKLRKIYARVQQIRALSYQPEKSKKERKQESLKENKNADDVLTRGYAFENEINLAFIVLARAAGFRAYPVRLAARNRSNFTPELPDSSQLNALVVEVILGSGHKFLDPATLYCRFGSLPWDETDAGGIRIDLHEGEIGATPKPESKDAVTQRRAEFKLDADGNLEGNLTITFEGQEALTRRLKAIDQDDAARRKDLEEALQHMLPQGAVVKLLSTDAWETPETPLKAQFQIQIPNYASRAGQRLVLPVALFHANAQNPFASARRTHPVYFEYPYEVYEDVTLALPPGIQVESLPPHAKIDRGLTVYEFSAEKQGNTLHLKRSVKMQVYYLPVDRFPALRHFYEEVRTSDEQQAILQPQQEALKN